MTFQALLVCKDEQATEVLTPVLAGFGMSVQICGYPDALCRLTEQKFEAVIVDYDDPHSAALVLQNASQTSSGGGHTITVVLLGDSTRVRHAFGAGANFVLYKPISQPQAEATLRAAEALIKRERRRSFRVPIQLPVRLRVENGTDMEGILLDLSEEGLNLLAAKPLCPSAVIQARFRLPDQEHDIDVRGEVAWANPNGESGVRYIDLPDHLRQSLKDWVLVNAAQLVPEDPDPVSQCKLTDLSLGGCYVETESPFPESSGITLCLRVEDLEVRVDGMVRVMHPAFGMGIEFASRTEQQKDQVGKFIESLSSRPGTEPELLITPLALTAGNVEDFRSHQAADSSSEPEDILLGLLGRASSLTQEEFLRELRQQRNPEAVASS